MSSIFNNYVVLYTRREDKFMTKANPQLIVMLTHNDKTVFNALEIFEKCKNTKADMWGMKEEPLPVDEMIQLYSYMKQCGKTTFLEVVAYSEKEGIEGAKLASLCNVDILMGTTFSDEINEFCKSKNIKYMPFVGDITERPSILHGSIDKMIFDANSYIEKGAYGIDLLGYRYTGDPVLLNSRLVKEVNAPVCLAGSVNSFQRLDEVKAANPWTFTIGSAFFENQFGDSFDNQIDTVIDYINK